MLIRIFKLVAAASVAYTVLLYTQGSWGAAVGMTLLSVVIVLANLRSVRLVLRSPTFVCSGWTMRSNG